MGLLRHRLVVLALTWAAAGVLLWLASRGADWTHAWQIARGAHPLWLGVAVASNLSILALWALLWRGFVAPDDRPRYGVFFEVAGITSAIMNSVPLLVGHASAVLLLVRRARLRMSTALSVLALDQLGEGLSKLAVFAAAAMVVPLPRPMRVGIASVSLGVGVLLVVLLALAHHRGDWIARIRWVGPLLATTSRQLAPLRRPSRAVPSLAVALAMKAVEALAIAAAMQALDVSLPPQAAIVILAATNLATMLPLAPANLGAYEAAAAGTWRWLGVPPDTALALALVQHACFLLPAIGAGVVVLVANGLANPLARTTAEDA